MTKSFRFLLETNFIKLIICNNLRTREHDFLHFDKYMYTILLKKTLYFLLLLMDIDFDLVYLLPWLHKQFWQQHLPQFVYYAGLLLCQFAVIWPTHLSAWHPLRLLNIHLVNIIYHSQSALINLARLAWLLSTKVYQTFPLHSDIMLT